MSTSSSGAAATESRQVRRVLRGPTEARVDGHAFEPVAELPTLRMSRPAPTGDRTIDAVRSAAWDEGLDAGLAEGRERGYAEGFAAGRDDGLAAGHAEGLALGQAGAIDAVRSELRSAIDALDAAAVDLTTRDAVTLADVERTVVDLAVDLAAAILDREATVAVDPGADAIRRALRLAPERGDLVVRLHPADLELLADAGAIAPGRDIELVGDPAIVRGGCLIETAAARVDARVDSALGRARALLLDDRRDEEAL